MANLQSLIFLLCIIINQQTKANEVVNENHITKDESNVKFIEGLGFVGNDTVTHLRQGDPSLNSNCKISKLKRRSGSLNAIEKRNERAIEDSPKTISKRAVNEMGVSKKRNVPVVKFRIENPTLYNIAQQAFHSQLQSNINAAAYATHPDSLQQNFQGSISSSPEYRYVRGIADFQDDFQDQFKSQLEFNKRYVKETTNSLSRPKSLADTAFQKQLEINNKIAKDAEGSANKLDKSGTPDSAIEKQLNKRFATDSKESIYNVDKPGTSAESDFARQVYINKRFIKGITNNIANKKKKREFKRSVTVDMTAKTDKYQEEKAMLEGITEGTASIVNDTLVKRNNNGTTNCALTTIGGKSTTVALIEDKDKRDLLSTAATVMIASTSSTRQRRNVEEETTSSTNQIAEDENKQQLEKSHIAKLEKRDTNTVTVSSANTTDLKKGLLKRYDASTNSSTTAASVQNTMVDDDDDDEEDDEDTSVKPDEIHSFTSKRQSNEKGPKHWDHWSTWSKCSVSCGVGKITRWRHCISGGCEPGEKEAQIKTCTQPAC